MNKLEELNELLKTGALDENEYKSLKEKLGLESEITNKEAKIKSEKTDFSTPYKGKNNDPQSHTGKLEELNNLLKSGAIDENEYKSLKEKLGLESNISKKEAKIKSKNTDTFTQTNVEKEDFPEETVQIDSVEKKETLKEPTKVTQKETAPSDSKKKSKTNLIVPFLIVGAIGMIGFLNQDILLEYFRNTSATDTATEKLDYYRIECDIIREYVNAIDNKDVIKAIGYWHDHPERYWDLHYPSRLDISNKIKESWRISSYSKNNISDIIKVDNNTYHLSTNFTHTSRQTGITETIKAKVAYVFNNNHMIISSHGIKINKEKSRNHVIIDTLEVIERYKYIKVNNLNLRSKPEIMDNIIGELYEGDAVEILEKLRIENKKSTKAILKEETTVVYKSNRFVLYSGKVINITNTIGDKIICDIELDNNITIKETLNRDEVEKLNVQIWLKIKHLDKIGYIDYRFVSYQKKKWEDEIVEEDVELGGPNIAPENVTDENFTDENDPDYLLKTDGMTLLLDSINSMKASLLTNSLSRKEKRLLKKQLKKIRKEYEEYNK